MSTQYFDNGTYQATVAVTAFRLLAISTTGAVTYCAANGKPDGVAVTDAASGDYVAVRYIQANGTQKGESSVSVIAIGDTLYSGALGTVSTTGTQVIGKALSASSATGTVVEFLANTL
jgi:hypothetical protein